MRRRPVQIVLSCILLALAFAGSSMRSARAAANTVSINKATTYQPIWGFGAAANHPVYDLQNKFSTVAQAAILDKLFRTDGNNAGLSIIRAEINPFSTAAQDPNHRFQLTFEPSDGVINWDTDQAQRWFFQEAQNRNPNVKLLSLPWSPPGWMKTNGSPTNGGNLRTDMYGKFVSYLLMYLDHYINTYGFDVQWLSIQNEPTNATGYASCTYSGGSIGAVSSLVVDAVHAQFPSVLVGAPEGATRGLSAGLLNGMSAGQRSKLDYILTHDYNGADGSLSGYGKLVINTEVWSMAAEDTSVNDAIRWANAVKAALQRGEPGWLYWWLLEPTDKNTAEGLIYQYADGTYSIQRRLYALGQFSRFMHYGDVRIQATSSNGTLGVVATKDPSGRAAILVINGSTGAITADVTGLNGATTSLQVYRTSGTENLANLADVSASGGVAANVMFAAQSITTLVEGTGTGPTPTPTPTSTGSTPTPTPTNVPATPTFTATPVPTPVPGIQINSGDGVVGTWVADIDFAGGTVATNWTGAIDTSAVVNPAPAAVYQSERYGASTYTIPGFAAGSSHTVRLHFCENFFTAAGKRVFNVSINGAPVLTNYDIFAAAGAIHKANVKQFTVAANASGQYVIQFANVTNNALIDGIEVSGTAATPTATSTATPTATPTAAANAVIIGISGIAGNMSFSPDAASAGLSQEVRWVNNDSIDHEVVADDGITFDTGIIPPGATSAAVLLQPGSYTYHCAIHPSMVGSLTVSTDVPTATPTATATIAPTPTPAPSLKINSGDGVVSPWVADMDFVGGTAATNWTGAIDTSAVVNPAPAAVYQSERYGAMTYTIPGYAAGSSHTVRLHFCENFFTATGKRVFNVSINGSAVLTNFDIFATAGAIHKATVKQFTVAANASGQIVIQFTNVTNNALVDGVEVN